jgi:hypothetical protein
MAALYNKMATKKHMMIQMTSKSIKAGKRLAQLSS